MPDEEEIAKELKEDGLSERYMEIMKQTSLKRMNESLDDGRMERKS